MWREMADNGWVLVIFSVRFVRPRICLLSRSTAASNSLDMTASSALDTHNITHVQLLNMGACLRRWYELTRTKTCGSSVDLIWTKMRRPFWKPPSPPPAPPWPPKDDSFPKQGLMQACSFGVPTEHVDPWWQWAATLYASALDWCVVQLVYCIWTLSVCVLAVATHVMQQVMQTVPVAGHCVAATTHMQQAIRTLPTA